MPIATYYNKLIKLWRDEDALIDVEACNLDNRCRATQCFLKRKMKDRSMKFLLILRLASKARPFSTDLPALSTGDATFVEAWKKVIPNMDPPKTPSIFMKPRPPAPAAVPSKLTVNFVLPYASELTAKEADMVMVPSSTGQLGVLPGHVPTIAELKPGLLSVHDGNDVKKYFVSSGFAFVYANSITDIIAVEAMPLEQIDPNLVQKGLADYSQKLSSASTELERAEAQVGMELHTALSNVLEG